MFRLDPSRKGFELLWTGISSRTERAKWTHCATRCRASYRQPRWSGWHLHTYSRGGFSACAEPPRLRLARKIQNGPPINLNCRCRCSNSSVTNQCIQTLLFERSLRNVSCNCLFFSQSCPHTGGSEGNLVPAHRDLRGRLHVSTHSCYLFRS